MTAQRIQRKRTKGYKTPPNTVYVGRPTKWGNPFVVGHFLENGRMIHTRKQAVELFEKYHAHTLTEIESLRGKNLSCFCKIGEPCHADVLLKLANK